MNYLIIKGGNKTPAITCIAVNGFIEISGISDIEDACSFYEPLFNWLLFYSKNMQAETEFNFKVKYFNRSSIKCIFDILDTLSNWSKEGHKITVNWYYQFEDKEMREMVYNFIKILNFQINVIAYSK